MSIRTSNLRSYNAKDDPDAFVAEIKRRMNAGECIDCCARVSDPERAWCEACDIKMMDKTLREAGLRPASEDQ